MATHPTKSPRRRRFAVVLCTIIVACLAVGLYWFQPWRLWTNTVVQEALPVVAVVGRSSTPAGSSSPSPVSTVTAHRSSRYVPPTVAVSQRAEQASPSTFKQSASASTSLTAPTSPTASTRSSSLAGTPALATILATGTLISHEHDTSGMVRIVRLADGRRVLTLENLRTSDGPALHVWLTDAPVASGEDGWKLFDDGLYTDLGDLKGNIGNQVYPLPADLDLSLYSSVSVWCERFSVSFGAAELDITDTHR